MESLDTSCRVGVADALVGEILTTEREKPPSHEDIEKHPFMEGVVSFEELDDNHIGVILSAKYPFSYTTFYPARFKILIGW